MQELSDRAQQMQKRVSDLLVRLDIAGREQELTALEQRIALPGFWEHPQEAQTTMRSMARLQESVTTWRDLQKRVASLVELMELARRERDLSLQDSFVEELELMESRLKGLEFELLFSGKYDERNAFLTIHAGAGGTESQDWASMLLRMYLRWVERHGLSAHIIDSSPGEEAGIKSTVVKVEGDRAYGYLKAERGVHRLVRQSPFDANHLRHTSFALVEVLPEVGDVEVTINSDDLRIDTFGAGGHGGQSVQRNATAVRLTHLPTGIVVTCQNERSQLQNRELAMTVLRARLIELELKKRAEEQERLKGEHVAAEWGNQIRSYVLHPYKLVKDHRTGHESTDPDAVLDGEIEPLLQAYLLSTVGKA
ncbi:MAG: peptide chain release factor 2 [Chloroflexi bacterium]|nr:peptide chain release factor 2 [Chloroflexota bacterium]